ncbi:MAG: ParB/RepB/Spo0J family partition protein [Chloroflexi bacterium]|nr:ParB/RepB/Spo0J family partition protein [Chloroflexota bacterium]
MKNGNPHYEQVDIGQLFSSSLNPRQDIGDIEELVESIRGIGILEPLLGRPVKNRIEVVAGSRRFAAAKRAGLKQVPVIVQEMTDEEAVIASVTENIHRGDLNLEDRMRAYDRLRTLNPEKYGSSAAIAQALGMRAARIADDYTAHAAMRQLKPGGIEVATSRGEAGAPGKERQTLPMGHAVLLEETMAPLKESLSKDKLKRKYVEVAKEIAPLPKPEAERFLSYVKKHPDKPTREIHKLAASHVERQLSLPAETAERLEERTRELGKKTWEDALEVLLQPAEAPKGKAAKGAASAKEPEEVEWLNKLHWNLNEGLKASVDFYTMGYEGRSLDTLLEALKRFRIKKVVDIRADPASAAHPEFNKANLSRSLKELGVSYVHHPELGMPPEKLEAAGKKGSRQEVWKWYKQEIIPVLGRLLRSKLSLAKGEVAFLCEERDPTACQRHLIAEHLTATGFEAYDI